jgi:mRNA interferase MazF
MKYLEPGEAWIADLGMIAKIRPILILTPTPEDDELALVTVVHHTTKLLGNPWELAIPKPWLKSGAFHLQQIETVPVVKCERRLGKLTDEEFELVKEGLRDRLDL